MDEIWVCMFVHVKSKQISEGEKRGTLLPPVTTAFASKTMSDKLCELNWEGHKSNRQKMMQNILLQIHITANTVRDST